jgi:PAS domain S-box-containing protein
MTSNTSTDPPTWSELSNAEERMRSIVDHVVDGIISIDERGTIHTFNKAAERLFGYSAAEVVGGNVKVLMPQPYEGEHDEYLSNYMGTGHAKIIGSGREVVGRRKDGTVFPMDLAISEFKFGEQRHFTGIVRDITERKRAEEARREAEERMRSVVDHVVDGIVTIDDRGRIESFNPAAEKLFGYSREEVTGRNVKILMPAPYEEQHDQYLSNYLSSGQAKIIGIGREVVGRRKDTSTFPMDLAVSEFQIGEKRYFTGIVRDITERKQLEHELRERLSELARADEQKNEFLAMLGHELRNPLAPMRNALHILKMPTASSTMTEQARNIIDRQLQNLVRLVDDLLDVSRIVRGKVQLQKEVIDLREPVRRATETALPVIDARGHQLSLHLSAAAIWVEGDLMRLSQVIANLLTNAAKYTDHAGSIVVSAEQVGSTGVVRVRDTGIGVPPELLPRIFDLFVQGDRTLERSQGGLGIGLTLVRRLVELHDGKVDAVSAGAGKGSEFVVTLPLAAAPAAMSERGLGVGDFEPRGSASRVLVVDDNVDACESVAMILRACGFDVRCLHDGPSVLSTALRWHPDVIVLDIGLPGMSGLEVATQLRQHEEFERTPLAALTGYGQEEDQRRSAQAGFNLHLTKPIDPLALYEYLSGLIMTRSGSGARPRA